QARVDGANHRRAVEAQRRSHPGVVHARPQEVARRAPRGTHHRLAAREHADGGAEHREAVDEIAGAVDRVDRPDHVVVVAGAVEDLLAEDVVGRVFDREPRADERLDAVVHLRDRVAEGALGALVAHRQRAAHRGHDLGAGARRELDREQLDAFALGGAHPAWRPALFPAAENMAVSGSGRSPSAPLAAAPGTRTRSAPACMVTVMWAGPGGASSKRSSRCSGWACHWISTWFASRSLTGAGSPSSGWCSQSSMASRPSGPRVAT